MTAFDVVLLTVTGDETGPIRFYARDEYELLIRLATVGVGPERVVSVTPVST